MITNTGKVKAALDESTGQIGAPAAWKRGYTGRGVTVAVLDTGYDRNHPDVKDAVTASRDFTGASSVQDGDGHGTHVASIIDGSGAASGGRYRGVAHGASLAVGKVLDDGGSGTESSVLQGMEWAAALPAEEDTYTLTVTADRSASFPASATGNGVETEWRFRSARTDGRAALPLLAVRMAPRGLDPMNRAAGGGTTEIPIWIEGTPSGKRLTSLEASYDDGETWREVPVRADGEGWVATVDNPDTGYVSLRAKATASGGNSVTHTFTRAYAVTG